MGGRNIIDLFDDCLFCILDYLPIKDRISFAQVCHRFRDVFVNRCGAKYSEYSLDETSSRLELIQFCICRESVRSLTIDLDHFDVSRCFRNFGCLTPVNCFRILCETLAGMNRLEHLVVKQLRKLITPIENPFNKIFDSVQCVPELKTLRIQTKDDCILDRLPQLRYLESLHLLVPKVPAPTLVKCCKSNGNLRCLHLGYSCIQRKLQDIVPHCKNLEVLQFGMTAEHSAYTPLAKLPRLRELYHFGIRRSGSFEPLLLRLGKKAQLTHLAIDGGSLTRRETMQLIKIQSLKHVKCFCATPECVVLLAQLINLEELCLWMSCSVDVSDSLLRVIEMCKNLKLLRLASGRVDSNFFDNAIKLIQSGQSVSNKS
ncbi:hypothetical protein KR018_012100, partial [Drosophila ironensis]